VDKPGELNAKNRKIVLIIYNKQMVWYDLDQYLLSTIYSTVIVTGVGKLVTVQVIMLVEICDNMAVV